MHYLYRYICISNVFYICIWAIVCNKDIYCYIFYVLSDLKTMKQIENLIITFQKEKNEMIVYVLTILIESVEQQ